MWITQKNKQGNCKKKKKLLGKERIAIQIKNN
jgi:hypothetical protein